MNLVDRRRTRSGLAAVEAALVLPLLLLLTFAVIEYGWMFMKAQELTSAVRNGARMAITPDATGSQVRDMVAAQMTAAGMGSGYTLSFSPDPETVDSGESLQVTGLISYEEVSLLRMPFIPTPANLTARVTMAKEGP